MNLTKEEVIKNREEFITLVKSINRLTDDEKNGIIEYLDQSDFFKAPASTKFHNSGPGGLCAHSLSVFKKMKYLYECKLFELPNDDFDSLLIVSLFHDIGKIGLYALEVKDKKVYKEDGSSSWEKTWQYAYSDDYVTVGSIAENSAYKASTLIPMSQLEFSAILNSGGFFTTDSSLKHLMTTYKTNKLAQYLYYANSMDMLE